MRQYFGTDGIRGKVGTAPITPDFVMRLGYAAGKVLATKAPGGDRPAVLIGKDTRVSGYMLEAALEAGLSAAGVDVMLVGPMPTPAVAYLTRALRLSAGIVISASHNPYDDNGIKFFSGSGAKLHDEVESSIEQQIDKPFVCMPSARLGKVKRIDDAAGRYIEFCKSTFPNHLDLHGLKIVVDCAHGAAYHIAPHVFHELGAEVLPIGVNPDGFNINDLFGATSPQALQMEVKQRKADLGLALDGDGDRLVMVDGAGKLYDGDQLLYVIARHAHGRGELRGGVVGTLMSNLAFEQALTKLDIPFARADVGDRYVLECLMERGWQLGGENSGHIICLDKHTTGDAIVAALQVLRVLAESKSTLAEVCQPVALFPQVLINVEIGRRADLARNSAVRRAIDAAETDMARSGRVLLRASGTEPVVRVMVEAKVRAKAKRWATTIADAVRGAA
jgi:phosphoglucosamine mutase